MKTDFPTISIDTREKEPYTFKGMTMNKKPVPTITQRKTLHTGDYSLAGFEDSFTIERKSVSDFYRSITQDRARFEREVSRMAKMGRAVIVVEGRFSDVLNPAHFQRNISHESVSGTVASWFIRHGVPFYFLSGRSEAEKFVFKLLWQYWRENGPRSVSNAFQEHYG